MSGEFLQPSPKIALSEAAADMDVPEPDTRLADLLRDTSITEQTLIPQVRELLNDDVELDTILIAAFATKRPIVALMTIDKIIATPDIKWVEIAEIIIKSLPEHVGKKEQKAWLDTAFNKLYAKLFPDLPTPLPPSKDGPSIF